MENGIISIEAAPAKGPFKVFMEYVGEQAKLSRPELEPRQLVLLNNILQYGRRGILHRQLVAITGFAKPVISRNVEKLIERGYVRRGPGENDRRDMRFIITGEGVAKMRKLEAYFEGKRLSEED